MPKTSSSETAVARGIAATLWTCCRRGARIPASGLVSEASELVYLRSKAKQRLRTRERQRARRFHSVGQAFEDGNADAKSNEG